jgi:5-enolpyruvylshikimate-3-phosphate synthase
MAAAVAGASVPDRATRIVGWEAVSSSYPTFAKHMADLTEGRAT